MKISIRDLIGADVGESLPFAVAAACPKLADLPKLTDLKAEGTVVELSSKARPSVGSDTDNRITEESSGKGLTLPSRTDRWLVRGTVTASIRLQCVRCLKEFACPIQAKFAEEFSRRPAEDQFPAGSTELDLTEMLRTVILLAVPVRPLHDPKCQGLCAVCGRDLNEEPHEHPGRSQPRENPFSKLKEKR